MKVGYAMPDEGESSSKWSATDARECMVDVLQVMDNTPQAIATGQMLVQVYSEDRDWLLPQFWGETDPDDSFSEPFALFADIAPLFPQRTRFCFGWCRSLSHGAHTREWSYWVEFSRAFVIDASVGELSVEAVKDFNLAMKPQKVQRFNIRDFVSHLHNGRELPLTSPYMPEFACYKLGDVLSERIPQCEQRRQTAAVTRTKENPQLLHAARDQEGFYENEIVEISINKQLSSPEGESNEY